MPTAKTVCFALILLTAFLTAPLAAQEEEEIIRSEANPDAVAEVTIDDLAWMDGTWRAELNVGTAEILWSAPRAGAIIGAFRMLMNGEVSFYQFAVLGKQEGAFMLRLKHFMPDVTAWEEKDQTVDFALLDVEENRWYFDGLTIERISAERMIFHVLQQQGDQTAIIPFDYRRQPAE